ncbi:MAG: MurR/RpiR family transcriptional regulator [Pseudomonadota bacterium]
MLARIKQELPALSPAERRVGQWVLSDPEAASRAALAGAAAAIGVSEPTIIRFARRFGASGFRAFKADLIAAVHSVPAGLHADVSPADSAALAHRKVVDRALATLHELRRRMATMPLEPVIEGFGAARQWQFCGLGASGTVAADAAHKFFRLGRPVRAIQDAPTALQSAAIAGEGDLLVFISHLGHWPELARAAALATTRGAKVLALTRADSPLGTASSWCLDPGSDEDTSVYTPMSSRIAQLCLLDALQVSVALSLGEEAAAYLRSSKAVLAPAGAESRAGSR